MLMLLVSGLTVGGAEKVVVDLATGAKRDGMNVVLVALNNADELMKISGKSDFDVHHLGITRNPVSVIRGLLALRALLRQYGVKVVHAHLRHALLLATLARLTGSRFRLIFTSHSFGGFELMHRSWIKYSRRLRHVDVLFNKNQHPQINAADCRFIPNGVDIPVISACHAEHSSRQPFTFIYVGRLSPEKNVAGLIAAFDELFDTSPADTVRLQIVGVGPDRAELEQSVANKPSYKAIQFLGQRSDISTLMTQADALVLTSHWEGLPLVALEAGANALPVLSTPVGALPELLADQRGYLADIQDMSALMRHVATHVNDAMKRGAKLRDKVAADYSIEHCVGQHLALYRQQAALR